MNRADIEKALEGLRTGLKSDGADLVVQKADSTGIQLVLVLGEGSCPECIVDSELLLAKVKMALTKVLPQVPDVAIHDPRNVK